ncbi:pyridoxamine 5'-phosphate oxidase family protein [Nocardiopsis sp. MG754419]|uniref:helix-turn-helix domain-containing protein n=1 Tax=Nocardiopsis sp. MG754419 TaxID=2259865 RepID=UPI001BA8D4D8|nr:pyridoxamine 5'-phosphate oxidase family protein [Nocardiopsis sp. MG754419]MBR8741820.1 DNA-binding protein [Nocardiopsis sp. MG754419]
MRREAGVGTAGGDFSRRAAARRAELGLSREDVAKLADMDPGYVAYLEEHAPKLTRQALYRLAMALNTTEDHLLGVNTDAPPGAATTITPVPETTALSRRKCLELMSPGGVGRIGLVLAEATVPTILPVNYRVHDGTLVFRTGGQGLIARHLPHDAAFEVDRVDGATSEGWSVLVMGRADPVTDEDEVAVLRERAPVRPWAQGEHDLYVRVIPQRVTGRKVRGRSLL